MNTEQIASYRSLSMAGMIWAGALGLCILTPEASAARQVSSLQSLSASALAKNIAGEVLDPAAIVPEGEEEQVGDISLEDLWSSVLKYYPRRNLRSLEETCPTLKKLINQERSRREKPAYLDWMREQHGLPFSGMERGSAVRNLTWNQASEYRKKLQSNESPSLRDQLILSTLDYELNTAESIKTKITKSKTSCPAWELITERLSLKDLGMAYLAGKNGLKRAMGRFWESRMEQAVSTSTTFSLTDSEFQEIRDLLKGTDRIGAEFLQASVVLKGLGQLDDARLQEITQDTEWPGEIRTEAEKLLTERAEQATTQQQNG